MYQMSHYSGLEQITQQNTFYSASAPIQQTYNLFIPSTIPASSGYSSEFQQSYTTFQPSYNVLFTSKPEYHFQPDNFLKPGRGSKFIGRAEEIEEEIQQTFQKIFDQPIPEDIKISILNESEFRKLAPSPGVLGLSINRSEHGLLSEIFVLNDSLGRVMLTLGHELGHVLTPTLENSHDEEAKAYAFSLIWMKVIKDHNIANLGDTIILENPANNGLHDVAFSFVYKMLREREIEEIYGDLVNGELTMKTFVFS